MNKRQYGMLVMVALVAGLIGGIGASWVLTSRLVYAQPAKIIQAERVEIVDKEGKVQAILGSQEDAGPILALGDEDGKTRAALMVEYGNPSLKLYDQHGKPIVIEDLSRVIEAHALVIKDGAGTIRAYLGSQKYNSACWEEPVVSPDFSPESIYGLDFYGADKRCRASLTDGEEGGAPRLELHAKDYDNSVSMMATVKHALAYFTVTDLTYEESQREQKESSNRLNAAKTDKERAEAMNLMERMNHGLNLAAMSKGSCVEIAEGGMSKARLGLLNGEPSLDLFDQNENTRATLGYTELKNTRTGSVEKRSPASLVLFGENGKVVWEAP